MRLGGGKGGGNGLGATVLAKRRPCNTPEKEKRERIKSQKKACAKNVRKTTSNGNQIRRKSGTGERATIAGSTQRGPYWRQLKKKIKTPEPLNRGAKETWRRRLTELQKASSKSWEAANVGMVGKGETNRNQKPVRIIFKQKQKWKDLDPANTQRWVGSLRTLSTLKKRRKIDAKMLSYQRRFTGRQEDLKEGKGGIFEGGWISVIRSTY